MKELDIVENLCLRRLKMFQKLMDTGGKSGDTDPYSSLQVDGMLSDDNIVEL